MIWSMASSPTPSIIDINDQLASGDMAIPSVMRRARRPDRNTVT